ncbi:hypothetical protein PAPYR_501 [Paratrimastix pyriformis]|uniref:Uncharacterized protein n=1 Tax=Paratrimastix pyriformis TaxID=342808 RepID=A0ABQ8UYR1_9EUKA|nr:hypothetical protein PAPYR_501 [Paratrimastix pyriformis]
MLIAEKEAENAKREDFELLMRKIQLLEQQIAQICGYHLPPPLNCWLGRRWIDFHAVIVGTATLTAQWIESRLSARWRRLARIWTMVAAVPTLLIFLLTRAVILTLPTLALGAFWGFPEPLTLVQSTRHRAWLKPVIHLIRNLWGVTPFMPPQGPALIAAAVSQYLCVGLALLLVNLVSFLPGFIISLIDWRCRGGEYFRDHFELAWSLSPIGHALLSSRVLSVIPLELAGFDPAALRWRTFIWAVVSALWLYIYCFMQYLLICCLPWHLPILRRRILLPLVANIIPALVALGPCRAESFLLLPSCS